jgi:DNA-binding winged helix-turn-helix (wHTH) protein
MPEVPEKSYIFEGFTLDNRRGCLREGGRAIDLRPKSFALLCYLVENAGRLVPKDELFNAVWPNVVVTDESLTRCVSDVRLAISDAEQRIIKTVPRRGYRFAAPVSVAESTPAASITALCAGGLAAPRLSVVVLPFANLGGEAAQSYFVDAVTDSLTTDLSRIPGLFVIARNTAFAYKDSHVDARQIGHELIPTVLATIAWRAGIDLNPIDVNASAETDWLETLVWPGHDRRLEQLRAALTIARAGPPRVAKGDLLTDWPLWWLRRPRPPRSSSFTPPCWAT